MSEPWSLVTGILEEVLAGALHKLPEEVLAATVLEEVLASFLEVPAENLIEEKEAVAGRVKVATAEASSSASPSMFSPDSPLPQPPRHPPPNSQDFLFYRGIEQDQPSPADPEEEWTGPSPPSELLWSPGPASPSSGRSDSPAQGSPL